MQWYSHRSDTGGVESSSELGPVLQRHSGAQQRKHILKPITAILVVIHVVLLYLPISTVQHPKLVCLRNIALSNQSSVSLPSMNEKKETNNWDRYKYV
jgi:hypothetical protein